MSSSWPLLSQMLPQRYISSAKAFLRVHGWQFQNISESIISRLCNVSWSYYTGNPFIHSSHNPFNVFAFRLSASSDTQWLRCEKTVAKNFWSGIYPVASTMQSCGHMKNKWVIRGFSAGCSYRLRKFIYTVAPSLSLRLLFSIHLTYQMESIKAVHKWT